MGSVNRFCHSCGTEVEDAGGFCLLGHPLSSSGPTDPLATLRAEVDEVFRRAEHEVAQALASIGAPVEPSAGPYAPSESDPEDFSAREVTPVVYQDLDAPAPLKADPIAAFSPPPRLDWGPGKEPFSLSKLSRKRSRTQGG